MEINISNDEKKVKGKQVIYEKCFIPENDKELLRTGLEVCARTIIEGSTVKNRITFRKGMVEAGVDCIHTAVCQLLPNPEAGTGFEVVSVEQRPELKKLLSPEDQYFSIKSFTQALIENGILNSVFEGAKKERETGVEPLDMNHYMRSQIMNALFRTVPQDIKEYSLSTLKEVVADDPFRMEIYSELYVRPICNKLKANEIRDLDQIDGGVLMMDDSSRDCIARNPNLPVNIMGKLLKERVKALGTNPSLPEQYFEDILNSKDPEFRDTIIYNSNLPSHIARELLFIEPVQISDLRALEERRRSILSNAKFSYRDFNLMIHIGRKDVIRALALNHKLPKDFLVKLAGDRDVDIRERVALNQVLKDYPDIQRKLVNDESPKVRSAVAERQELPDDLLKQLINDKSVEVRRSLAESGDLPNWVWDKLVQDADTEVVESVLMQMELPYHIVERYVNSPRPELRNVIASRLDLSPELMMKLAEDEDDMVRRSLANLIPEIGDIIFPDKVIDILANDPLSTVRRSVAYCDHLTENAIKKLANDPNTSVLEVLVSNKTIPTDVRDKVSKRIEELKQK